jgi:hypothetical protein
MRTWVTQNIHPIGLEKKNRGSLYAVIARVFGRVRDDAHTAVKAHFPFLSNEAKLKEHGKALYIPNIPGDMPEEYRQRVSTASFFLSRAGERAYIREQMEAHFGGRFILKEAFLQVFVTIVDLTDEDRGWVLAFLDSILDPAISLTVAEWFHFVEYLILQEEQRYTLRKSDADIFPSGLRYNGRFLCDQGALIICNGDWVCDGSVRCDGIISVIGTIFDYYLQELFCNGRWICNGNMDCSGFEKVYEDECIQLPILPREYMRDELFVSLKTEQLSDEVFFTDLPMNITIINPLICDGSKMPTCSRCDGSIMCDGSYAGFDGRYYREEIMEEVI